MRVLLVEDNVSLAKGLCQALSQENLIVEHVSTAAAALQRVTAATADILVLDLGLPDMDGLQLLRQIRRSGHTLPILLLTARDTLDDKVVGLDTGADDYLAKPFEMAELLARIRVLERRLGSATSADIEIGPVTLVTRDHNVYLKGEQISLPRREYMLLKALMEGAGRVQTRDMLESKLYSWDQEVASNALEVHIYNLRKKLGSDFITTVRGIGYVVKK